MADMLARFALMLALLALLALTPAPRAWADDGGAADNEDTPAVADKMDGGDEDGDASDKRKIEEFEKIADAVAPSLVIVEYWLQYDKGQAPELLGSSAADNLIDQERPLEITGYLLDDRTVLTADAQIHPRFVKSIRVRYKEAESAAAITAWGTAQSVVYMTLDKPLADAKPLAFAEGEPAFAVVYGQDDASWQISVREFSKGGLRRSSNGERHQTAGARGVITDEAGRPVAMVMNRKLPPDDSWLGSPLDWPRLTAKQREAAIEALRPIHEATVIPVTLRFRSPSLHGQTRYTLNLSNTERHVPGVVIDTERVLILATLRPSFTAHLEQVTLNLADGKKVDAQFLFTLKDYGGFVVKADSPLAEPAAFSEEPITGMIDQFMLTADVTIQGERAQVYYNHDRIDSLARGWRRQIYPSLRAGEGLVAYDTQRRLAVLPISRRGRVTIGRGGGLGRMRLTPVSYLEAVIADPKTHADPNNIPRDELEAERLAWLGVEMQPLNTELARANDVSELTDDGKIGGLVTHVYDDSPAADAGLQPGMILVRLHVPEYPKPLDIEVDEPIFRGEFPWEQVERVPVQRFERIPAPWRPRENALTRALTDLGVGKKYTLEYVSGGEVKKKEMTITRAPVDYRSTPRFKTDPVGLTVRDMTYESRRYFQKTAKDPGVLVSKVESGSKADTAGIKPFEIITAVNDKPVQSIQEFEKAIDGQTQLRFAVTRFNLNFVRMVDLAGEADDE